MENINIEEIIWKYHEEGDQINILNVKAAIKEIIEQVVGMCAEEAITETKGESDGYSIKDKIIYE